MKKNRFSHNYDSEITRGEIIVVGIAFIIWTALCIVVNLNITNNTLKKNEKYYKSIKIDNDEKIFKYAMKADEGNALVYGTVKAIDTVTLPEIVGEYMAIKVEVERYNQYSREVEDKNEDGEVIGSHIETWEEWNYETSHLYTSKCVKFLGVDFPYSKFRINNYKILDLDKNISKELLSKVHFNMLYENNHFFDSVGDLRYTFYVVPTEVDITAFGNLRENNMFNVNLRERPVEVHYCTIPKVIEKLENGKKVPNVIFTIIWYIAFIGGAYYFVMQRNKWADM